MATNTCNGILVCSDGTNIPLKGEIVEGTQSDLSTDSAYTVSSMSAGDYAPGKTIVGGLVTADSGISFAYVLSAGVVAALIPVGIKGVTAPTPALCAPYQLKPGDKVRVLTETASARDAALCVYTASGVSRIFVVTPSSGTTNELIDLQTSNSFGETITPGDRIVKAFFTSIDGSKIETPGAVVVDALGNVVGSVSATDPSSFQASFSTCNIPSGLNFKAQFLTNA